jgi:hypothetical protein
MRRPAAAVPLALLAAACAGGGGDYPSLAVREAERIYASGDPIKPAPVIADRPGIAARIGALLAAGRDNQSAFEAALATAQQLAGRAGGPGSDSWVAAQQAVSRAEAARASIASARADLDAFAAVEAAAGPVSDADFARLTEGSAQLHALATRQQERLDAVRARLGGS